jgi:tetratricopeptide (TPR) repeat protein
MSDDYFKKEIDKIEVQINNLEQNFTTSMKETFDKINKDIKSNEQKNKFKLKVETEHQLDDISKIFNEIHSLEIKRREMMLKKLKQDQSRTNDKFKSALKSFRENLFSNERNNLSTNEAIENFLKDILKIEQQLVLAKNEDSYNIIMDDFSLYQLSTKYYQSTNMSKFFIKGITNNYKLLESMQNYQDILEYIDGILNISEKIVENKADILHKYAMKLFKEGNYDEAQKKLELAVNTTKDKKGKMLLQFDLDKVVLTNMHCNVKNFKHADCEQAIQICDRLLESPYIKERNKEKIRYMRNLDVQRLEQLKNQKNNIENKYKSSNLIREEVNEIDFELGDEQ